MIREACVETIREALAAEALGADRIELCDNLDLDGTTPSIHLVRNGLRQLTIPLTAMVRPRAGSFHYTEEECALMLGDVLLFREMGLDGVAFGLIDEDGGIDMDHTASLIEAAGSMKVTFHKAFDHATNPSRALDQLIELGVSRVLTSGGEATAQDGLSRLKGLVTQAADRIQIVAAGKVTLDNVRKLNAAIPDAEFHGRLIVGDLGTSFPASGAA